MRDAAEELDRLRGLCPEAQLWPEGGRHAAFLPGFAFKLRGQPTAEDVLLVPFTHSGYETRLFFRRQLTADQVWHVHVVCGQTWWSPSWRGVLEDRPWTEILADHLRAVA